MVSRRLTFEVRTESFVVTVVVVVVVTVVVVVPTSAGSPSDARRDVSSVVDGIDVISKTVASNRKKGGCCVSVC